MLRTAEEGKLRLGKDSGASVASHLRVDNTRDPLTRLASADESASSSHPLPQGGEGSKINSPLAPLGERGPGVRGSVHYPIVNYYAGHHTRIQPLGRNSYHFS